MLTVHALYPTTLWAEFTKYKQVSEVRVCPLVPAPTLLQKLHFHVALEEVRVMELLSY